MNSTDHPLVTSVCYVRLAIAELQAGARFASDIFGLQRVAGLDDEIAFRSDHRFRTVSFSNDTQRRFQHRRRGLGARRRLTKSKSCCATAILS